MPQKGLGKGLGELIAMFDEENRSLTKDSKEMKKADENARKFFELDDDVIAVAKAPAAKKAVAKQSVEKDVPRGATHAAHEEVEVGLIDNNPNQPRKHFDEAQLTELSQSIMEHGVLQPIVVNKVGHRFMIVAGERRWRAARMAGLNTIPAVVREFTSQQIAEIAIVENLQRADLNEMELARGIKSLMDEFNMTQEKVSLVLGKNRSTIANTIRLLSLPEEVQALVESRAISAGHAKCLVVVSDRAQCLKFAHKAVSENLSVRQLEELVKSSMRPKGAGMSSRRDSEIKELEKEISRCLGTKVSISGTINRGKITIEYYLQSDLEKIKDMLT